MKKTIYFLKLLSMSCMLFTASAYADEYYMISSDSNNCRVHWHDANKGFVYVTGSDCTCMNIDQKDRLTQWVVNFGDAHTPLGCYPALDVSVPPLQKSLKKPADCELGDHCTQYQCLKLLFEDNTEHGVDNITLQKSQCVDQSHHALGFCDENGRHCQ